MIKPHFHLVNVHLHFGSWWPRILIRSCWVLVHHTDPWSHSFRYCVNRSILYVFDVSGVVVKDERAILIAIYLSCLIFQYLGVNSSGSIHYLKIIFGNLLAGFSIIGIQWRISTSRFPFKLHSHIFLGGDRSYRSLLVQANLFRINL